MHVLVPVGGPQLDIDIDVIIHLLLVHQTQLPPHYLLCPLQQNLLTIVENSMKFTEHRVMVPGLLLAVSPPLLWLWWYWHSLGGNLGWRESRLDGTSSPNTLTTPFKTSNMWALWSTRVQSLLNYSEWNSDGQLRLPTVCPYTMSTPGQLPGLHGNEATTHCY